MTSFYQFARFYQVVGLLAALLPSAGVQAGPITVEAGVQVEGAWTRASLPGQDMAMVYMNITSKQAATIVGAASKASKSVEMHHMEHKGGMMKMHEVKSIGLSANERLEMNLHGYHLVLAGLKAPLKEGISVPLTLNLELTDKSTIKINVKAEVKPLKDPENQNQDHSQHHH